MPKSGKINFGPKEFAQGLSPLQLQQSGIGGFFATARAIDVYRFPGFIAPGPKPVNVTNMDKLSGAISAFGGVDPSENIYGVGDKLYQLNGTTLTYNYLGAFPHTYSVGSPGVAPDAVIYPINNTNYLLYFLDTNIGRYDLASTFVDNWGSTVPTNAGSITSGPHRKVVFNGILYFTNGNMVSSFNGALTSVGTLNILSTSPNTLVLPKNYIARDIRIVNGNLEVYANTGGTKGTAAIFTWDGVSPLPLDQEIIDDNFVGCAISLEGFPHIFTSGRDNGFVIRKKNYYGYQSVQVIQNHLTPPYANMVDTLNGMICFSTNDQDGLVYTFGTPFSTYSYRGNDSTGNFPDALHNPFFTGSALIINGLKTFGSKLFVSYFDNNSNTPYLQYFDITDYNSWNNAYAQFQTNFTQLPDDSTIDYIRFYVLPPAANASFTPALYTDFGATTPTLDALTANNLDANGKSKTYYADALGAPLCDNFAIGGTWGGSSTTGTVVITRIEIGYTTK